MIGKDNLDLKEIKSIAKKYPNRAAFQKAYPGLYVTLWRKGEIDKICSHMKKADRSKVKAPDVINQLKNYSSTADLKKRNPYLYRQASALGLLNERNITLTPQKRAKSGQAKKWTKAEVFKLASKYEKKSDFIINEASAMYWLKKNNLELEFSSLWEKKKEITNQELIKIARLYKTKTELKYSKEHGFAFPHIINRSLEAEAFSHMKNGHSLWRENSCAYKTESEIIKEAKKYKNRREWFHKSHASYIEAKKRGIFEKCISSMKESDHNRNNQFLHENKVLHPKIAKILSKNGFDFRHELSLTQSSRPDFTLIDISGRVFLLEVKSELSYSSLDSVRSQLERYKKEGKEEYGFNFGGVILVSNHPEHEALGAIKF
jgi:hypothetical protein